MNKKLIERIEKIFTEKISKKTGWGKNEILANYKEAVNEAVLIELDNVEDLTF